jgi:hypothetical protein
MKQQFFRMHYAAIIMLLVLILPAYSGGPITFQEYKKLPLEERQKMAKDAPPDLKKKFDNWNEIISMGGQWWKPEQAKALVKSKGFDEGFFNLAIIQEGLWGYYYFQTVAANKKSNMTAQAQNDAERALEAEVEVIRKERYKDQDWYLVKLAPTPEAVALNEKAWNVAGDWSNRFPMDGVHKITRNDLKALDAAVKEIRDQMRKLPELTPEQIEDALSEPPTARPPSHLDLPPMGP